MKVRLDRVRWRPGERLSGHYELEGPVRRVRVTIRFRTKGSGTPETRLAVERTYEPQCEATKGTFDLPLPRTPLTYEGALFRIGWFVQVVADEIESDEADFILGDVAPARRG